MGVEPISVPQNVAVALTRAGDRNGVDFGYLLDTAMRESSLDPNAKNSASSATGLFQFLESTWLEVMKEQGPRLGYGRYAAAIEQSGDGNYVVRDRELKSEILKLRENPQVAADLAAAYTRANGESLATRFGRQPSPGELYIAHFLGAAGAERLFVAGQRDPEQVAAPLFPRQAAANPSIFYDSGKPRSVREVYRALVNRHETGGGTSAGFAVQQMVGSPVEPSREAQVIPSRFTPGSLSFTAMFKTEAEGSADAEAATGGPSSPFFTQLYGQ